MNKLPVYNAYTEGVLVSVTPEFMPARSIHAEKYYAWAYTVTIENKREEPIHLLRRSWKVIHMDGRTQEVHGDGVIGLQPVILPGQDFTYSSGTHLDTPSGMMLGHYDVALENGDMLNVEIPAFSLDSPFTKTAAH